MTSLPYEFTKGYAVVMRDAKIDILYDLSIIETISTEEPGSMAKLTDTLSDWTPKWKSDAVARHNGHIYHNIIEAE